MDDSELTCEYLTSLLRRESDFELVGTAADGCQALWGVDVLKPDLVLMDVNMPRLNGLEAARIIKRSGQKTGYAPVIVIVSEDGTQECRSRAEAAGADGFVPKSGNLPDQLKSTLDSLFSENRESLPADIFEGSYESSLP